MANQNVLDLRDVAAKGAALEGQIVTVEGWVRNHRKQKSIGFIEFFDGTVLTPMQIVYDDKVKDFAAVQAIRNGAAVRATGKLVPGRNGALEMQAEEIILEGLHGGLSASAEAPHAGIPARHRLSASAHASVSGRVPRPLHCGAGGA